MWFIGVEVEQETSAPPPKKILDPPLCMHVEYIHSIFISHLSTVSNLTNQIMIMIPESGIHGVSLRNAWHRAN